jgi:hypothetical protein
MIADPVQGHAPSASEPPAETAASAPDPFTDAESLEALEDEIATLAAHIHAATHRLLVLIRAFDRRRGWELGGHRTCAHWLSARTGIDLGAAREKVRAAHALEALPLTSACMARGELSFSKVRALTRVATRDNEGPLLELARGCTTAQLERMVRGFRRGSREDEAALERRRSESRCLSVFPDEDGMYVVQGRLPAEVGALLMRAVEAASDALYREERAPEPEADTRKAAAQRRADALGLLAERAMEAGFGGTGGGEDDEGWEGEEPVCQNGADPAKSETIPISGTRAQRYQVVLHVESETLAADGQAGRSELEDGTRVSAETSQRLACDAGLVRVDHAPDGSVLDVGRRSRTVPPAVRRALEVRDRGCRFPGCGLRFAEGHHVVHWAKGGETKLTNLVLLCRHHHRLVHEGGWKVEWWGEGRPVFFDPRGGTHFDGRWRAPEKNGRADRRESLEQRAGEREGGGGVHGRESPVEDLMEENRRRGADPDGWTAASRWKREADIPDRTYFEALEAMGEAGA